MGIGAWFGVGMLLVVLGGILSVVTGIGATAAAALLVISVLVLIVGAATRSALAWVGLIGALLFGGMLLFAFLGAL